MKRYREGDSTGARRSPRESDSKRRKNSHRSSPVRYSSSTEYNGVTGGISSSRTGDVECILDKFLELRYRFDNIEEKLNSLQYQLKNIERLVENMNSVADQFKNIERFLENLKPLQQEESQLCVIM